MNPVGSLNEDDFRAWCRRLQLSESAVAYLSRVRSSPPSRAVGSGAGNVSGAYPSRKMGVTIQFESHKNELAAIHRLEHDPEVLEYYDQPEAVKLSYADRNGRQLAHLHTPDFLVLRRTSVGWEECKPEAKLRSLAEQSPNRYVRQGDDGPWSCPPGETHARSLGFFYRVASSAEIDWTLQRNLLFLEDYYRAKHPVTPEAVEAASAAVTALPGITLAALIAATEGKASRDDLFALIVSGDLHVDLSAAALAEDPERVHVFRDRATARAIAIVSTAPLLPRVAVAGTSAAIDVRVGTNLLWDGRAVRIVNVGLTRLSLLAEDGRMADVAHEHFEMLLKMGLVTAVAPCPHATLDVARDEAAKLIAAASPEELATANLRYLAVEPYLRDDAPIMDPLPAGSPPIRSLRRWRARYRAAEATHGCGFLGLLPDRSEQGNRTPKLPEASSTLMTKFIAEDFETITNKTATAVYGALMLACEQQGVVCPSRKTFLRAIRGRPQYEQLLKRGGRRKAYAREPFYLELEQTTPRHGDRPFEIAHIDHTELDVELVCSRTGRNLGRPWLTLMVDAFTRRILALYLTFDPPSYRSCMMALRICVLRHGRLPQTIVTDGGKEFASVYFQALLAAYEITRKTRPPAKARFGAVVERLFGTANKQFVHLLTGNTQLTRNVRQVTKSVNPKAHATWTLPALYGRLMEYAYDLYDGNSHPALGQTPAEAFASGLELGGERLHRRIAYDEGFKMLTLPTTLRGVAKVQPGLGAKVNYLYYWASELGNPEVEKSLLPVRYDPFDLSTAYVFVAGRWTKCVSSHWQVFRGRSERELMLASAILHRQNQNHAGRELLVTTRRLAEFMAKVQNDEEILRQRDQDAEAKAVFALAEGSTPAPGPLTVVEGPVPAGAKVIQASAESASDPQSPTPKPSPTVSPWAAAANLDNLENFQGA